MPGRATLLLLLRKFQVPLATAAAHSFTQWQRAQCVRNRLRTMMTMILVFISSRLERRSGGNSVGVGPFSGYICSTGLNFACVRFCFGFGIQCASLCLTHKVRMPDGNEGKWFCFPHSRTIELMVTRIRLLRLRIRHDCERNTKKLPGDRRESARMRGNYIFGAVLECVRIESDFMTR